MKKRTKVATVPTRRLRRLRRLGRGLSALAATFSMAAGMGVLAVVNSPAALAAATAVIPTSPNPGTSPTTINNYQQVTFPANDDGTWPCGGSGNESPACPGPSGETGPTTYPIGFNINFFGSKYSAAYVNNNGNVTFGAPLPEYTPADLTTFANPIVAPFFADVDTRGTNSALVNFGTGTLNGQKVFVVNWPGVGCFDQNSTLLNNFQLILIDRPERGTGSLGDDFDMEFNYNTVQWDTGQASGGDVNCQNGPAGETAYVGYSNGTTTPGDSYNLPGSGVPQAFLDSSTATGLIHSDLNSTTLGRYIFTVNAGQPTAPTSLATSLAGGGQHGTSISVPAGTNVSDAATLSGANASTATGTVTYDVYSDSACTNLASGGSPEDITTPGTLPGSKSVSLTTPGTYYWQVVYSGDSTNNGSSSPCAPTGTGNEVETVTAAATSATVTTALSGAGQSGAQITVPTGTAVTDSATLSGANASTATGTVTYNVYSDSACTVAVSSGTPKTISTAGTLPASSAVSLATAGSYYWKASYSGDSSHAPATSTCGTAGEVEKVTSPVSGGPSIDTVSSGQSYNSATAKVSTTAGGDLLVAFVAGDAPTSGGQTAAVSGGGLTWTLAGRENTQLGDAEVWTARATGVLNNIPVTAQETIRNWDETITVVAFKNAPGIGTVTKFNSAHGAPTGTLATSQADSRVFAIGDDWLKSVPRTLGSGQTLIHQATDAVGDTYWVQAKNAVTPNAGTTVTINDTAPTSDPYNLVLVEIL